MAFRFVLFTLVLGLSFCRASDFEGSWSKKLDRVWIGPEYWANPLEDWRVHGGRLECIVKGRNRNVALLTHELVDEVGTFSMSVELGLGDASAISEHGWLGFRIGTRDEIKDYRTSAVRGKGLNLGITTDGRVFIGRVPAATKAKGQLSSVKLLLSSSYKDGSYVLRLVARSTGSGEELGSEEQIVRADILQGGLALVCNGNGKSGYFTRFSKSEEEEKSSKTAFWFNHWKISGSKVKHFPDRRFGPILWTQQSLSRGVFKLMGQMPPLGKSEASTVRLEVRSGDEPWSDIGEAGIGPLSRTVVFRIESWDSSREYEYRLTYDYLNSAGEIEKVYFSGQVRRDPLTKDELIVAGFTGHKDFAFPNVELVRNVSHFNPDLLFFSGDQIYEGAGGYPIIRTRINTPEAIELSVNNFLRHQMLFGWSFRDLMRDRPSILLPDDHDVYQGNIWGNGGNATTIEKHPEGGFAMHPDFVNEVIRISTGHHPDVFDARPMKQGIDCFYGDMVYGGVSFAIIEDRYFKSGPLGLLPPKEGRPDHITDPQLDTRTLDVAGAKLLGERQLNFLRHWARDWRGADMKAVLSATIFANVANYHGRERMYLVADLDSNGWPQTGRNKALDEIRRGFGLMYAGDQHLASIVHHGIDEWRDAGISFCVPSIAAGYPRSWNPKEKPLNHESGMPSYTGDFRDGLGNLISVFAVGNPEKENRKGILKTLHDKASGFGLVRFNRRDRTMALECYKLLIDPSDGDPQNQFPGWPRTVTQRELYGRKAVAWLPTIQIEGGSDPVVQIIDESNDEVVYTLRIQGRSFQAKVFHEGTYTVAVGGQGVGERQVFKGVQSGAKDRAEFIAVKL